MGSLIPHDKDSSSPLSSESIIAQAWSLVKLLLLIAPFFLAFVRAKPKQ